MKNIVFVYDNIMKPNKKIKTVIGERSYADIILRRKKLYDRFIEVLNNKKYIKQIIRINSIEDIKELKTKVQSINNVNIVHIFSNYLFSDEEQFNIIIDKSCYINENIFVKQNEDMVMLMYNNDKDYVHFLENYKANKQNLIEATEQKMDVNCFINLEKYNNFLNYISGGFDARFFNKMTSDENIVIKKSTDKKKIKKEYEYYKLLPDEAKKWMVLPYNYTETETDASYTMERIFMPDLAIRWTHGAIGINEFKMILDKLFYYIQTRKKKEISAEQYKKIKNDLYVEKLEKRVEQLKEHPKFEIMAEYIKKGTDYKTIDDIVEQYKKMYYALDDRKEKYVSVIGHGDLCFSNILYNEEVNMIRLIDPKGALTEEELWTNPYYDIAKLSHSICGLYDFFNCGLYEISLNQELKFKLNIQYDNYEYKKIFKDVLKENGFEYNRIRIYEASLFLSMLPLHMDYPKKVFGFLLNGISILEEIEKNERDEKSN